MRFLWDRKLIVLGLLLLTVLTACGGGQVATETATPAAAATATNPPAAEPIAAATGPQPTVVSGAGDITAVVEQYRQLLGGVNNGGDPGSLGPSGYREINWDSVPDELAAPNPYPADFFNAAEAPRARGIIFDTPGSQLMLSADSDNPYGALPRFGNINPQYADIFQTFSEERLFSPVGSNIVNLTFYVPGTNIRATVRGFGAVYTDVDTDHTAFEYFDVNGQSLGQFQTPIADNGLSFLGVVFDEAIVYRVEVRYGTGALGPNDGEGGVDVAVMDNFIYGEPQAVPGAEAAAEITKPDVTLTAKFATVNDQRLSSVNIDLTPLTPLPTGKSYGIWFSSSKGWTLAGNTAGGEIYTYLEPSGKNLVGEIDGLAISLEDTAALNGLATPTLLWYEGHIPANILADVRLLVVSAPDTPANTPYDPGLKAQSALALSHAQLAQNTFDAGDLATGKNHIEHVNNLLLGSADPGYGDLNGDGATQDPGDGYGVFPYALKVIEIADRAAEAPGLNPFLQQAAFNMGLCARNVSTSWGTAVLDQLRLVQNAADLSAAQAAAPQLVTLLSGLAEGVDANGNGVIEAAAGECGANQVYEISHDLFDLQLEPK